MSLQPAFRTPIRVAALLLALAACSWLGLDPSVAAARPDGSVLDLAPQASSGGAAGEERPGGAADAGEAPARLRVRGNRVAVGDAIDVPASEIRDGDIVCIFCELTIDGVVTGDVVVVGGSLRMSGAVRRSLVAVVADTVLEPGARVGGDLTSVAGRLDDRGAEVRRSYTHIPLGLPFSGMGKPLAFLTSLLLWLRTLFLVLFFIVVLIVAAVIPDRVRRLSDEVPVRYFAAFFVGLAAYAGLPLVALLLIALVVGLPFLPFLLLLFVGLTWLGRAGLLHLTGQRVARMLGVEVSLLGATLLGLIPYVLLLLIPLLLGGFSGVVAHVFASTLLWLFLDVPAVGLILLTRAGSPSRAAPAVAAGAAPPAPTTGLG